jgi:gliding motility-associated-like protein
MSKKILFILLLISSVNYAQLSNKHWLPPLHSRDPIAIEDQYLYLSTPEVTPFLVNVTDGSGTPFPGSPFLISATNSVRIDIGTGSNTKMFLPSNEVNTILSDKGLILEGTKDFYVSFRLRHSAHSETLISKGRPGIGIRFRLGCMINEPNDVRKSFVASVMATEDNTTITLSDYDAGVIFVSGTGDINDDTQTFILNAGQSVIFSGYSNQGSNLDGIIGALVTSNNPVAVNTGNAIGGIVSGRGDFTLDQIVSASQIGTEYIFIEGNGLPSMELPLLVANEDDTEIYVNGSVSPITTINAGDYFLVPNSFYQGTNNKNLFVRTNRPVFAYQLLGGGADTATCGLNFIPPLSCFFQNSVNIPDIDQIGDDLYNADLMILTYATATITINGTSIPTTQAEAVLGNTDWVTYRISNITGDANVSSTGPLAVGVFGYQGNISGYAGYYSGFGSNPEDTTVAVCSNQTIDLFEAINGNPGENGTWTSPVGTAPIVNNIFDPAVNSAGVYTYEFTKNCNTSLVTIPVDITVTIEQAPFVGTNKILSVCKNDGKIFLFDLLNTGVPTGGTWSPVLDSGTDEFDPSIDASGIYTYTIQGNAVCSDVSATITVTNNDFPVISPISNFELCDDAIDGDDTNGSVNFDLTLKTTDILGTQTGITVTYHTDPNEAILGQNAITSIITTNRVIYVRLTNNITGCFSTTSFNLVVKPLPVIDSIVELKQCDTDSDAVTDFNLTQANIKISTDATYVYSYHNSPLGALNNTDFVSNEIVFNARNGSQVWARITNTLGCSRVAQVILTVAATTIPQTYSYTITECDDYLSTSDPDNDGIDYFDLTEIEPYLSNQFIPGTGQSYTYSYYLNEADATAEQNPITNITNFRNTLANNQTIWVRIESNLYECAGLGPYLRLVVDPLPDFDLGEDLILCIDPVTGVGSQSINATPSTAGSYSYQWTPINSLGNSGLYNVTAAGTYSVVVTNSSTGCQFTDSVNVTTSSAPASLSVILTTPAFSSGLATIEAIATGGFGIYEYSLNAIDWQSSPIFSGLENGSYTIYARDIQGCDLLVSDAIQTITYPNYFTPNGDGYNDTWVIRLPVEYDGLITIYDRYGKLIKQISSYGAGWDGTFNGITLPSTDFWFKVEYTENNTRKEFKSHFSLKR